MRTWTIWRVPRDQCLTTWEKNHEKFGTSFLHCHSSKKHATPLPSHPSLAGARVIEAPWLYSTIVARTDFGRARAIFPPSQTDGIEYISPLSPSKTQKTTIKAANPTRREVHKQTIHKQQLARVADIQDKQPQKASSTDRKDCEHPQLKQLKQILARIVDIQYKQPQKASNTDRKGYASAPTTQTTNNKQQTTNFRTTNPQTTWHLSGSLSGPLRPRSRHNKAAKRSK